MEQFNCKEVRDFHLAKAKEYISTLSQKPRALIVQVGDRPDSNKYIKNKMTRCEECGIEVKLLKLPEDTSELLLINYIKSMQNMYHAIILQCPLPKHINEQNVMSVINPIKDCDGLHYINIGHLHSGNPQIVPATAQGILDLLDYYNINVSGMNILLVGRSHLVNRPLQELLCQRDATVTLAHSKTNNLQKMLNSGDYQMVIGAIGKPKYLKNVNTRYIIDVGINVVNISMNGIDNKIVGDFDINSCNCRKYTTVPSGVGLLTQASIVNNIIKCYNLYTK